MNILTVDQVKRLCQEVQLLCHKYQDEYDANNEGYHFIGPKLTGELRRRSMDLTRALAEMRK